MKVVIAGFDGYGKSVIDSMIEQDIDYEMVVLDDNNQGEEFAGVKVAGTLDDMQAFYDKGFDKMYIANENDLEWRKEIAKEASQIGYQFITVIDKTALVSKGAEIGEGTYIAKGAVVDPAVTIGENVIVNVGVTIQSESSVGSFTRLSTASIISHGVEVGAMCYVGAASVVTDKTVVPDNTIIEDASVYGKQPFEE